MNNYLHTRTLQILTVAIFFLGSCSYCHALNVDSIGEPSQEDTSQDSQQNSSPDNVQSLAQDPSERPIQPKDKVSIEVNGEKDLSGVFTVGPDGEIEYPLLGAVHVDGLSPADIKKFLRDNLGKSYLTDPEIEVTVNRASENVASSESPTPSVSPKSSDRKDVIDKLKNLKVDSNGQIKNNRSKLAAIKAILNKDTAGNKDVINNPISPEVSLAGNSDNGIIDVGDKLNVQVLKEPDLSGLFNVNSSGKVNFPLIGEVQAQSLSLDEFKQSLFDRLNKEYVKNPQIEVTFSENPNKSVSILGQVNRPGNYVLTHQLTLLKLLSQIGGFVPNAATKSVRIVREGENRKKETQEVNVDDIIQGKAEDVFLKAGDIIFVDFQIQKNITKNYITILGQIAKPGNYAYTTNITLIRLVGEAGGFTATASMDHVKIIRKTSDGKKHTFFVNASSILSGRSDDVELEEGDLIVVPESFF